MKKFLLFSAILFLVSCSDLSVSNDEALKMELPADFNRGIYAEINKDVAYSQIVLSVKEKLAAIGLYYNDTERKIQCIELLSNEDFAGDIYLNYALCPKQSTISGKCPGIYGYDTLLYNKAIVTEAIDDTVWQCNLGGCWNGGWDEISEGDVETAKKCQDDLEFSVLFGEVCDKLPNGSSSVPPLKDTLSGKLNFYAARPSNIDNTTSLLCNFVLPGTKDLSEAKNYIKEFKYDSTLFEIHYNVVGRNEGRPYKYCESGKIGVEKNHELSTEIKKTETDIFYDYGKYAFCLDKLEQKIYVAK
jgi:hypothetical protein